MVKHIIKWVQHALVPGSEAMSPEYYLSASGETLILLFMVSMPITYFANYEVLENNNLLYIFGYNNFCVFFDEAPAQIVATPILALYIFFSVLYVYTDSQRALVEKDRLTTCQFNFTLASNGLYGAFCLMMPLWLILVPKDHPVWHTAIFLVVCFLKFLVFLANVVEAEHIPKKSLIYIWSFGILTVVFITFATIDMAAYDYALGGEQTPPIPGKLLMFIDYFFLILLGAGGKMLPPAPAIRVQYQLLNPFQVELDEFCKGSTNYLEARKKKGEQILCPFLKTAYMNNMLHPDSEGYCTRTQLMDSLVKVGFHEVTFMQALCTPADPGPLNVFRLRESVIPSHHTNTSGLLAPKREINGLKVLPNEDENKGTFQIPTEKEIKEFFFRSSNENAELHENIQLHDWPDIRSGDNEAFRQLVKIFGRPFPSKSPDSVETITDADDHKNENEKEEKIQKALRANTQKSSNFYGKCNSDTLLSIYIFIYLSIVFVFGVYALALYLTADDIVALYTEGRIAAGWSPRTVNGQYIQSKSGGFCKERLIIPDPQFCSAADEDFWECRNDSAQILCPVLASMYNAGHLKVPTDGICTTDIFVDGFMTIGLQRDYARSLVQKITKDENINVLNMAAKKGLRHIKSLGIRQQEGIQGHLIDEKLLQYGTRGAYTIENKNDSCCEKFVACLAGEWNDNSEENRFYPKNFTKIMQMSDDPHEGGNPKAQEISFAGVLLAFGRKDPKRAGTNSELYLTEADLRRLYLESRYPDGYKARPWNRKKLVWMYLVLSSNGSRWLDKKHILMILVGGILSACFYFASCDSCTLMDRGGDDTTDTTDAENLLEIFAGIIGH
jgi:hypothetical protein